MGILDIRNRTENWKTARSLSGLFGERAVHLAIRLGEPADTDPASVHLELYWKGVRDYCYQEGKQLSTEATARLYRCLFPRLRGEVKNYGGFRGLQNDNYAISTKDQKSNLVNNLFHTEIDVVMETPGRLYIGEAKYKTGFHAASKLVLVHQLIRQYVTAKMLVAMVGLDKEVIPFVIGGNEKQDQVKFMIWSRRMREDHVLSWEEVEAMVNCPP